MYPTSLPATHQRLLLKIIDSFSSDQRIVGIGASGSFASDSMDKYSDLDLVIAVRQECFDEVMNDRFNLVEKIPGKVAAFTGEHVGEPRLVISLYAPDCIHVDFKFVVLADAAIRVDENKVLWERDGLLSSVLRSSDYQYPQPDGQWIEDRFWIWLHYGATKIARGEYFEATEFLSFLRTTVLSPMALRQAAMTPSGVRKLEARLPDFAQRLKDTVVPPERNRLIQAYQLSISLYLELRQDESIHINSEAEKLTTNYFREELL
ncbi:MAG: nucleotidyltransferase domain-containing protein [Aestuariibacter sp.]